MVRFAFGAAALVAAAGAASAAQLQVETDPDPASSSAVVDGVINMGEYAAVYSNGAGSGFGGPLGSGSIHMDSDGSNLQIGLDLGSNLSDGNNANVVAIWFDSAPGGFNEADMNDEGDGARRALSNFFGGDAGNITFPFGADQGLVFSDFGAVFFQLAGSPDQLQFISFDGSQSGSGDNDREASIPLSEFGSNTINFWSALTGDSGFGSNETLPQQGDYNAIDNPGFNGDGNDFVWENWNTFVVPTPGAATLLGLAGLAGLRRRRA
jgi:hypothetical protein